MSENTVDWDTDDTDEEWDSEEERIQERLSRMERDRAMRRKAQQQAAAMGRYRQDQLDRETLDAELDRLRQAASRHCGASQMPSFYQASAGCARAKQEGSLHCSGPPSELEAWRLHAVRWEEFERAPPPCITANSMPWPPSNERMLAAMAALSLQQQAQRGKGPCQQAPRRSYGADEAAAFRRAFRAASLQWHPDKFLARYQNRMGAQERQAVVQRLQAICQAINDEWSAVKPL